LKNSKILLVEPSFPFPNKSKNKASEIHKNFVPVGLLKLGAMYKDNGAFVKLVRGNKEKGEIGFIPQEILVTSLFTYWSSYVWGCIQHYRQLFPNSEIQLGGIYATLHADTPKFKELAKKFNVRIFTGINHEAEKYLPDYTLLPPVPYHVAHMMRGCIRKCSFCGTWRIEPKLTHKTKDEIVTELTRVGKNKVIFYDNNILANPHIREILAAFSKLKINGTRVSFESQSGFDGRLLEKDPELAKLIKKAGFTNIRIAWDNSYEDKKSIKKQIKYLVDAGYNAKEIFVFMIYNFDIPYETMIKKLDYCKKLGIQITDCRNRPLELDYDGYNPHKRNGQPEGSFYVHKKGGWTDKKIRDFRRHVRRHNIWIRYAKDKGTAYDKKMEKWSAIHNTFKFFSLGTPPLLDHIEKNQKLSERIKKLGRLKAYCKQNQITPPDFSTLSTEALEISIDDLIEKIKPRNIPSSQEAIRDEQDISVTFASISSK